MNTHQVIDNYFSTDFFNNLKNKICTYSFPWNFNERVATHDQNNDNYYFTHSIYRDYVPLSFLWDDGDIAYIVREHLNATTLIRAKVNLYLKTPKIIEHAQHRDCKFSHKGAIIYLNTCDGYTRLEDGTKIESVENRLLLFDASQLHNSTTTTNAVGRYNININYI